MSNNEIKLPDFLNDLINNEKREGIERFKSSDFEKKIYNRIRDQKRGRRVSLKWVLVPASLILIFVSTLILFKRDSENPSWQNKFQMVLENVINENSPSQKIPAIVEKERKKIEKLQNEILASDLKHEITTTDLSQHIKTSLLSATGENEPEFKFYNEYTGSDFLKLKEDIGNMNKKNDYSELFSRIIIKLTEG